MPVLDVTVSVVQGFEGKRIVEHHQVVVADAHVIIGDPEIPVVAPVAAPAVPNDKSAVTVRVVLLLVPSRVAFIVTTPSATELARPVLAPIVAILSLELAQETSVVIISQLPSSNVPLAVNCLVKPRAIDGLSGVI